MLLAVALAGCIDHRCPRGYDQKGDTCHRKRDAGPDGAVDADASTDAESDAEGPIDADDASPMDAGNGGDAEAISCGEECGEHEVCERVDDAPACACAGGYDACESGCADQSGGELSDVVDVEAGTVVSCAITAQRDLWCWGANQLGGLGSGDSQSHVGAVQVELADVSRVAVGWWHTFAIARDGQVYCWGSTPALGLGEGAQNQGAVQQGTAFSRPQKVLGLDDAVEIRAGKSHSCARRRSGHVLCWGANEKGQLGDGTAVARLAPTPVVGLY